MCEQLNITTSPETAKLPWGFIFISQRDFRCAFWFLVRRCLFAGTLSSRGSVFSRPHSALTSGSAALVEGGNKIGANDNLADFSRVV